MTHWHPRMDNHKAQLRFTWSPTFINLISMLLLLGTSDRQFPGGAQCAKLTLIPYRIISLLFVSDVIWISWEGRARAFSFIFREFWRTIRPWLDNFLIEIKFKVQRTLRAISGTTIGLWRLAWWMRIQWLHNTMHKIKQFMHYCGRKSNSIQNLQFVDHS